MIPGGYTVRVSANGFVEASRRVTAEPGRGGRGGLHARGRRHSGIGRRRRPRVGYSVPAVSSATKTTTPLRDVPQAVSVVSSALIADQRMSSMADVTRYMPGVGFAQGEGNRDTPILRGNSSTSDFFVDGVRDDVQYFRDVYNVDRVEALKGPNAMIFGRGGVGGVINRVTRQADWGQSREASLQFGSWDNKRFTADVGRGLNESAALRATALYENSDSYRDGAGVERYGFNPTVAFRVGPRDDAPRQLRVLSRRAGRRPRHLVVQRASGRDGSRHVLRRPVAEPDGRDRQSRLIAGRAPVRLAHHAQESSQLRRLRQVLPERVSRRRECRRHDRGDLGLQQRDDPTESVQPDGPDRLGTDRRDSATRCSSAPSSAVRRPTTSARPGFFSSLGANVTTRQCAAERPDDLVAAWSSVRTPRTRTTTASRLSRRCMHRTRLSCHARVRGGRRPQVRQLQGRRDQQPHGDRLHERRRRSVAAAGTDLQADSAAVAVRQLQPDLPAAGRRTTVVAVADESGARSRGVPQLRSRREVGRRSLLLVHGGAVPPRSRQRHRSRSQRSGELDPGRRAANQGTGARAERATSRARGAWRAATPIRTARSRGPFPRRRRREQRSPNCRSTRSRCGTSTTSRLVWRPPLA